MASLRDLCANVPVQLDRLAVMREVERRKTASYLKRISALSEEQNVFQKCKATRPQKRWRNRASSETAGTVGMRIREVSFPNSRTIVVCKTRQVF